MMSATTFEPPSELFVWCWLPGAEDPVVAGRVWREGPNLDFNYGASYLERDDAMPLFLPELPLRRGRITPADGLTIPGCIADAMPDGWGRRVIAQHLLSNPPDGGTGEELDPLTYLALSGSDRFGAIDFQASPEHYVPRETDRVPLAELAEAAAKLDAGETLSEALDRALLHGSSIGGARPKALLDGEEGRFIAKFSAASDREFPFVKAEFAAMELARRAGLDVSAVSLRSALGRDALLVERFDRVPGSRRRLATVSALTIFGLPPESTPIDWSYAELAEIVRARFASADTTLRELFGRIVFNVLISNIGDHPRNHAAFWDGAELRLTPAYDLTPQRRSGATRQLMAIDHAGRRDSRLSICIDAAPIYHLSRVEAQEIVDRQVETIEAAWDEVCDAAEMTEIEREMLWRRQFLNPYAFESPQ